MGAEGQTSTIDLRSGPKLSSKKRIGCRWIKERMDGMGGVNTLSYRKGNFSPVTYIFSAGSGEKGMLQTRDSLH